MSIDVGFSRQVADALPTRSLAFLRAVGTVPAIREALAAAGYNQAEQDYGWQLVLLVSGYRTTITAAGGSEAGQAIVELDNLDESLFKRSQAVLDRFHPEQAAFVFDGLQPAIGTEAVVSVATLLTRLDALESSPAREATRTEDHAALESLAKRGIDKKERDRLAALVTAARQMAGSPPPPNTSEEQQAKDMIALHKWYQDWSETARAVIKRRDHLVRLGLTKRKKGKRTPEPIPAPAPFPAPAPSPAPAPTPVTAPANGTAAPIV